LLSNYSSLRERCRRERIGRLSITKLEAIQFAVAEAGYAGYLTNELPSLLLRFCGGGVVAANVFDRVLAVYTLFPLIHRP
jgi:hypothetical protein